MLDVLANGLPLAGGGHVPDPGERLRGTLRGWPGAAELLPRYPAVVDGSGTYRYPHEVDVGWLRAAARSAYAVHQDIDAGWRGDRERPELLPRIGFGHGTARRCEWDGHRFRVTRADPELPGLPPGWASDRGDGTVPTYSGVPSEMAGRGEVPAQLRVAERHGPVMDLAHSWRLARGVPAGWPVEDGEQRGVVLGLDLETLAAPGSPFPVTARVIGVEQLPAAQQVWVSIAAVGGGQPTSVLLDPDGAGYIGELPPLEEGSYAVRATAEAVPGAGDLETSDTLIVLPRGTV